MHVDTKGSGPHIILIHGLAANNYAWSDLIENLHSTYTTHAVDLIGFGKSVNEWSILFRSTMKSQARQVISELDKKGIKKFSLVGHSMGGGTGLYIANLVRTERRDLTLEKMALVAPVGYPPSSAFTSIEDLLAGNAADFVHELLKLGYYDPSKIEKAQIDAYASNYESWQGFPALFKHAVRLPNIANLAKHYSSITVETKLIWGAEDKILNTASHAPKLEAALHNATLETIPKCGHNAVEECADKVTATVKAFLDS